MALHNLTMLSAGEYCGTPDMKLVCADYMKVDAGRRAPAVSYERPYEQSLPEPPPALKDKVKPFEQPHTARPYDQPGMHEPNQAGIHGLSQAEMHEPGRTELPVQKEKAKRDRKVLHPQAKELILNVVNFMKQEANGEFAVPARKVQCRAAMATGFSERTVRRVVKESKSLPPAASGVGGGEGSISFPPKKAPNRPKPKTGLDALTRCAVRKAIHRIYVQDKTVPTIRKIHQRLVQEIGFKGGSRSAHKIVKELGFYWKKTKAKSYVLLEKHDIRLKRIEYLRDMARLRHEGRAVVYVGDAVLCRDGARWLHAVLAATEHGLVPGSLYSVEGETELAPHLPGWVQGALGPALPQGAVVVLDGAALDAAHDRVPALDADADEMRRWLQAKGIAHRPDLLRPELHQVIRRNAGRMRKHKGRIEQMLVAAGHTVLRTPNEHPDLNPVALVWADVRRSIAEHGGGAGVADRLAGLGAGVWAVRCAHVRAVEAQYLASEGIVDAEVERVLAAGRDGGAGAHGAAHEHVPPTPHVPPVHEPAEPQDPQDNNINFVRHFMGGLLGLQDHKMYTG